MKNRHKRKIIALSFYDIHTIHVLLKISCAKGRQIMQKNIIEVKIDFIPVP